MFISIVVFIQLDSHPLLILWTAGAALIFAFSEKNTKSLVLVSVLFGFGFYSYLYILPGWIPDKAPRETGIFLNRLSLSAVLLPLAAFALFTRSRFNAYWRAPEWKSTIRLPFIWRGFHKASVFLFLIIALITNILAFLPFFFLNEIGPIKEVVVLSLLFSVPNAFFEELIWRGVLLTFFTERMGEKWAVLITSLGFGLQHYSLGFPWTVCLAFAIGGLFYGGITVKSGSLFPAMIWHFALNLLMAASGAVLAE